MKKIIVNNVVLKIPESFIMAAYAGACAAHQVAVHEDLFGKDNFDFHEHFTKNFQQVKETCTNIVEGLTAKLTLKEVASHSPANNKYGGF